MKKIFSIFFVIGFLAAGCNVINGGNNSAPTVPNALVKIINVSPDSSPLGLFVNGASIFNNIPYLDTTTYFQVGPQSYAFNFFRTDTTNYYQQDTTITTMDSITYDTTYTPTDTILYQADSMVIIQTTPVALQSGVVYSIFLIDSVNKIETAFMTDNVTSPSADSVKLRFFHFCSNGPALDLAESGGGPVLFSNRTFNDQSTTASFTNFNYFLSGSYNLELRLAGTSTVVASLPAVNLRGGRIYTLFAKGFVGGKNSQAEGIGIVTNN